MTAASSHPSPLRFRGVSRFLSATIRLLPWLLALAVAYVSFLFPIKQDRYGHSFFSHMRDRAAAYFYLLKSPWKFRNACLPLERVRQIIDEAALRGGVEPCLVQAVALYESGYYPNTVTTTGGMGLLALMPATARRLGVSDPYQAERNADAGTALLGELLQMFQDNVDLALAAYNAGPERVKRAGTRVPPFPETIDYVAHVKRIYEVCRREVKPAS